MNDPLNANNALAGKFGPYTLISGILLVVLGTIGIFLPDLASLGTVIFVAWLLIIGGVIWAIHTWRYSARHVMDWIKPALLFAVGGLMLFKPASGIAAIGLLLSFYLMLDAFGSFALAQSIYPVKGWGWMAFNGLASLVLAVLFLIGWPMTSLWLVGLYVSISLIFDGSALIAIALLLRKIGKS